MPYNIDEKLVIAVASSALFDLAESDRVFREQGEQPYRDYQRAHEHDTLKPGIAFAFVKQLLSFNRPDEDAPVEVILLSRNDPDTGLRVFNSIAAHGLDITRAAFLAGGEPWRYIRAYSASLFLSANEADVRRAIMAGYPAGLVLDSVLNNEGYDTQLRIAFDFDGVIADDQAEKVFAEKGIKAFFESEVAQAHIPHNAGPLKELLDKIAQLQKVEKSRVTEGKTREPRLRVAIVTARNAPAHTRLVTSLREWGITVDETFLLGGLDKSRVLAEFEPHIFFDDQRIHLDAALKVAPCVHVPFGTRNESGSPGA